MNDFEILDPRFSTYVLFNAPVERLASGFRWTEGPVWFGDAGALLFSDIPNDRILRWIEGVGVSVFRQPSQFANGNTRDREGRLITCSHGARAVLRTELDGAVTTLADRYQGRRLNSPNDVVVKSDGTIWFTDPHYGIRVDYEGERAEQELPCHVYRLDPASGDLRVVADDFGGPNGLAFSPGRADALRLRHRRPARRRRRATHPRFRRGRGRSAWRLARVPHRRARRGRRLPLRRGRQPLDQRRRWRALPRPDGTLLGKIRIPEIVSNVTFGGRRKSRLFICAATSLYAVYLNRRGIQHP